MCFECVTRIFWNVTLQHFGFLHLDSWKVSWRPSWSKPRSIFVTFEFSPLCIQLYWRLFPTRNCNCQNLRMPRIFSRIYNRRPLCRILGWRHLWSNFGKCHYCENIIKMEQIKNDLAVLPTQIVKIKEFSCHSFFTWNQCW